MAVSTSPHPGAGLAKATGEAVAVLDYDTEGDLDLALGEPGVELFRNALQGPLEPVGKSTFPSLTLSGIHGLAASDLDRDGDLDLLVAHAKGIAWLGQPAPGALRGPHRRLRPRRRRSVEAIATPIWTTTACRT